MFLLNLKLIPTKVILSYLNTSNVSIKHAFCAILSQVFLYLNTSNVSIKHALELRLQELGYDLNTSNVSIKRRIKVIIVSIIRI